MKKNPKIWFSDISIKEISSIFINIDDQIIDLHKCSSDDFLGLSTDFKKYYHYSKDISDNAGQIFKLLSEESNRALFIELQTLYKDLTKIQSQSRQNLKVTSNNLSNVKSLLEQLFIPIKNIKQNLSTIRFLVANINLSDIKVTDQNKSSWDGIITENISILSEYRDCCLSNEKLIFALESDISQVLNGLEPFCQSSSNDFENLLNNIHYAIIFFAEKYEEVKLQIPELTLRTENNSQNISDIITNLQYQDIIRQKIEHIQKGHSKILPELQELYDKDCSNSSKESQLFQKVKDIAGLQAAILVSANKEYQLAIEKITSKFLGIGDDMIGISSICTKLNSSHENSDDLHLIGILDRLNNSEQILSNFIERTGAYHKQIKTIGNPLNSAMDGLTKQIESNNRFSESTNTIISFISEGSKQDSSIISNLTFLNEVNKDIHQFETAVLGIFNEILKYQNEFSIKTKQLDDSIVNNDTVKKVVHSINSVLKQVESKEENVNQLLDEIVKRSSSTVIEIKESIKRIRYYDLFEKSITSIIAALNDIQNKLNMGEYDETKRSENLSSIKKLYTMDEEHRIHEHIVSKTEADHNLDVESTKTKSSDEVELF
jgi:hypothetical protein